MTKDYSEVLHFQYPRTDRRCCDLCRPPSIDRLTPTFSILERIDDVVTDSLFRLLAPLRPAFSILERIDDVVTLERRGLVIGHITFQYPRTDRRCCDALSE